MKVKVENYIKKIGQDSVLNNITLEFESGKIYGLKGKNGSGKTMIMRAVCGLIRPTSGRVIIDGEEIGKNISFPRSVGALIENPGFLNNLTGYQNLKILSDIKQIITSDQIVETIKKVGLDPNDKRKVKKYSLGMRQKLGIAAAIMENPELVILDEPTNALDQESKERLHHILQELKSKGTLIILASHDRDELESLCDSIYVIEDGIVKESYQCDLK